MRFWVKMRSAVDRHPLITDSVVALVLTGLASLNLWLNWNYFSPDVHPALAVVLVILGVMPLAFRRKFPISVLIFASFIRIIKIILEIPEGFSDNALFLALLSAAAFGGRWRNWACGTSFLVIIGSITYTVFFASVSILEGKQILLGVYTVLWNILLFGAAWWFGSVLKSRREKTLELEEKTIQLGREREENARRAVLDERLRIARELHDVLAHHISLMGIQAGAARRTMNQQPVKAQESLSLIEQSSRQAVDELHRLLGFLRQEHDTDELRPQPSLKQLDELVTQMRQAGLPVDVSIEGNERLLNPAVDLSAYRIVEEALTNTLKHAGKAQATVILHFTQDALELEILDDGKNNASPDTRENKGKGLIGMRERVILLGGEFKAGKTPRVGFSVRARLPLSGRVL
jgi:signal transduction histidine kinase